MKINLIQEVRVLQAIDEAGFKIRLPFKERQKLQAVERKFKKKFGVSKGRGLKFEELITLDHSQPKTTLGSIEVPLLYPHYVCTYLRSQWKQERPVDFSFSGLYSEKREEIIKRWMFKNDFSEFSFLEKDNSFTTRLAKGKKILIVNPTLKGRDFPIKAWDHEYYELLLKSQFVLCPSGDYVWTYRFFESILCGAIPVVEDTAEVYTGFRFKMMEDDSSKFTWSEEDANFNYSLFKNRLTVSKKQLLTEMENLVGCK